MLFSAGVLLYLALKSLPVQQNGLTVPTWQGWGEVWDHTCEAPRTDGFTCTVSLFAVLLGYAEITSTKSLTV